MCLKIEKKIVSPLKKIILNKSFRTFFYFSTSMSVETCRNVTRVYVTLSHKSRHATAWEESHSLTAFTSSSVLNRLQPRKDCRYRRVCQSLGARTGHYTGCLNCSYTKYSMRLVLRSSVSLIALETKTLLIQQWMSDAVLFFFFKKPVYSAYFTVVGMLNWHEDIYRWL